MTDNVIPISKHQKSAPKYCEIQIVRHSLAKIETQLSNIENFNGLGSEKAISLIQQNLASASVTIAKLTPQK